jgi:hypothetical protein
MSKAGISIPDNISISQMYRRTDKQTVIDRVKMKCAGIASPCFDNTTGQVPEYSTPKRKRKEFSLLLQPRYRLWGSHILLVSVEWELFPWR